ncbi:endonuclease III domain-containing protein [Limisalsivibrio acetivorans]|uniref:endonuclease III domain-containing protein n=1 Tax=Limisalsivibrio acetivorans TaxID=1304888 RepID=UPI0003B4CECA|nr:endonuclease [Limisalsivibrio acetivorans]
MQELLLDVHRRLAERYIHLKWWPADTDFEMACGAILTQNTNWRNVEKAIAGMKDGGLMSPEAVLSADYEFLKECIRPSGYFNQKAERLVILSRFILDLPGGTISGLAEYPAERAREMLLDLKGVGEETCDSILLYGAGFPVFVVDAYTMRVFTRLGILESKKYGEYQRMFMDNIEPDAELYGMYHGEIVEHAATVCLKRSPKCGECVLAEICERKGVAES